MTRTMTVIDCPPRTSAIREKVYLEKERERLFAIAAACKEILSCCGIDADEAFSIEYDEHVGLEWRAVVTDDEFHEAVVTRAIALLGDQGHAPMARTYMTTAEGLARALSDCCTVTRQIKDQCNLVAKGAEAAARKPPPALMKEESLHKLMLGASGPLELSGPSSPHEIDEMIARLHSNAPWMRRVTTRFWNLMSARLASGSGASAMPPAILYGPPGTGKTQLAASFAAAAGMEYAEIDAASGSAGFRISGVESGWSSRQIGEPLRVITETRCPNPVIVVNEVDKAGGGMMSTSGNGTSLINALLPVLDERTAQEFRCPATGLVCDLSGITWILTANNVDMIPAPLRTRCEMIEVPALTRSDFHEAARVIGCDFDDADLKPVFDLIDSAHLIKEFSLRHVARAVEHCHINVGVKTLH